MRFPIDPDWAIHYLNAHPGVIQRLGELQEDGLALSIISCAELDEGVFYSRDPVGDARDVQDFLRGVEVFSDDCGDMARQARTIAPWGAHVYVKIPVTNTWGESSADLVRTLACAGVQLNVTALMTLDQVQQVSAALVDGPPAFVSVFAGRIADTGCDPMPLMAAAVELLRLSPNVEIIWASPRELLKIFQADSLGCHIITATNDIRYRDTCSDRSDRVRLIDTLTCFAYHTIILYDFDIL
jgi:hypothetical protein